MSVKPKIAVIGLKGLPAFGGAAKSVEEIIKKLSTYYSITTYEIESHADSNFEITNVNRIILKAPKLKRLDTLYYYFRSTLHCLFGGNYDLIFTNHLYCGFIIPFLRLKYKVINVVHGIIPEEDNKWNSIDKKLFKLTEKLAVKYSNLIISVAEPHLEYLKRIGAKQPIFIPNGVDCSLSETNNVKKRENYILFAAARIIHLKGLHTLLRAVHEINNRYKIKIIGDLDQVDSYKTEILNLSTELDVEFLGIVKDRDVLFDHIMRAWIFVFPSYNEGMSNMLLEVASLQTPIICSNIVENKAVFDDNEVLFFKVGDSLDLAKKINWALENYADMQVKAKQAYTKLINQYDWESISIKYRSIIDLLLVKQ